jgi:Pectate lyase superfamily protein
MTAQLIPALVYRDYDANGNPLVNGQVFTYAAGTTTPQATYTDSTQTTQLPNPAILNYRGEVTMWLNPQLAYKFIVQDSLGNTIRTVDNVGGPLAGSSLGNLIPSVSDTYSLGQPASGSQSAISWTNLYLGPAAIPVYDINSGNIGYYIQTSAELAANIVPTDFSYAPGNVCRYGAVGDGVTNNTAAFTSAISQALQLGGATIFIPGGNFVGQFIFSGTCTGIKISGGNLRDSIVTAISTTADVFTCSAGASIWGITIENLSIKAAPSSTGGNGIHFPTGLFFPPFDILLQQLYIYGFGNSAVYDQMGIFNSLLVNVFGDQCAGHIFDLFGDNTLKLQGCYAGTTTGSGTCGYRLHSDQPVLDCCNGVNAADYWGIFSDTTPLYCSPVLIGCNVEAFNVCGVYNMLTGFSSLKTTYAGSVANSIAIKIVPNNAFLLGTLDNDDAFELEGAGSWLNGHPVHTATISAPPFATVVSPGGNAQLTWYDELTSATAVMTTIRTSNIAPARAAFSVFDLYTTGLIRAGAYCGKATLSGGTATVTLSPAMPTTSYIPFLSGNAGEMFSWASLGTGSFVINSSNGSSTATVGWLVIMTP